MLRRRFWPRNGADAVYGGPLFGKTTLVFRFRMLGMLRAGVVRCPEHPVASCVELRKRIVVQWLAVGPERDGGARREHASVA